jgi:hypothetical protein
VAQTGDVKRRVISILDRPFPEFATYCSDVCGQTAHTVLETWTLPEQLAAVPTARLTALLARLSHGHFGTEKAQAVKEAAPQSISVRRAAEALAMELRLLLRQIRELEHLVADLDQESGRRYVGLDHYLRTIPGLARLPHLRFMPSSGTFGASQIRISWWHWWESIPSSMSPGRRQGRRS